jgi:hypothetical protein
MEPTSRYGTRKAIDELVEELNLPFEEWMQDWPYEIARPSDIEKYIDHYEKLTDEDKKFVLMEAIIQATEEQASDELFAKYWDRVKPILEEDFAIHEYTIHCWSCFDNQNLDECWKISSLMRKI